MISLSAQVNINDRLIRAKMEAGTSLAQKWLDVTAVKDTDEYVPKDTHVLGISALSHTDAPVGSGRAVYNTPYARAQYYGLPRKNKRSHPHATMRWFEASSKVNMDRWKKGVGQQFAKGWKGAS